ncbi:hypothetical protein BU17DRAFT_98379 [Hysterangium stoloniferum]|nr:hypothetical protein BU17DRAFT_98379 [Hysterangium stoloniferum]
MSKLTFVSCLLVLSQAVQVIASPSAGNALGLFSRQGSLPIPAIPSQCQSACTALSSLGTTCPTADLSCICSDSAAQAFGSCANCVSSLPGATPDATAAQQQALQSLTQSCQAAGHPFNVPLSGGSGTGSGAGTGTNAAASPSPTGSSTVGSKSSANIVSSSTIVTAIGLLAGFIAVAI